MTVVIKKEFLQNVIEFRNLKVINDYESVAYVKVGNNFPFIDDRDVILERKIVLRPEEKKIYVPIKNSKLKIVPEQENTVRIPKLRSSWLLEALSKTRTKITYQTETDPGGYIPKWLVNFASRKLPFGTLQKLRKISEKKGVDVVVNFTGGDTWAPCLRAVKPGGRVLTCGATAGHSPETDLRYIWVRELDILGSNSYSQIDVEQSVQYASEGKITPVVSKVLPLAKTAEAESLMESRDFFGKIILCP